MIKIGHWEFRAAVALARLGNFRAAAIEMEMSSSALSHSVSSLEERLGVRLFNRTTRSVSTTDAGAKFLGCIAPLLTEIDDAIDNINSYRDTPSGTLRLNTSLWAAQIILRPIIIEFINRFPAMSVVVATEESLVDVVGKGFDAGIRLTEHVPQDMIAVSIGGPIQMTVAGSPEYFKNHPQPRKPADLASHQCIRGRMPDGSIYRWEFEKFQRKVELDVPGTLVLDEMSLMIDAALAGVGLIYLDEQLFKSHLDAGLLVPVLQDWCVPFPGFSLYYPGRHRVPAGLRAFIAMIRENREILQRDGRGHLI